jgi:tetratricopeptide (TPR) repeat protein
MDFWSIAGNIVASIIVGVAVFAFGRSRGWWAKAKSKRELRAAGGAQFTILVAQLEGDADQSQTRHVLAELRNQFPQGPDALLRVIRYPETLAIGPGDQGAALAAAEERGRRWLKETNADVLIWGEEGAKDRVLRLHFLTPEGQGGAAKPYALNETLELPVGFGADLGTLLAVQAAAAISPVYERTGEALAALIAPVVAKLKPLAENPPPGFSEETRAQLWHAYADGERRLGEERGDNARLATAIAFYKKTLSVWTRDEVPLDWAMTQNNLGIALARLGKRESGTVRLEEAVSAYRAALLERTRERVPFNWAMTQNNLGEALRALGERESGTARLEEAVSAFRGALLKYTRDKVPLSWATAQNNLGNALFRLGEREGGTARLEQTVSAYRAALLEFTRDKVPLDWAMTQNNLGNALFRLGEREGGTARLEQAVSAYRAALFEYTRDKLPLDWAMAQNNLGNALLKLGERESGGVRLEEAVSAYRAALSEYTRDKLPLDWAMTQNNLGSALQSLGERQAVVDKAKGCVTLEGALGHFAAAPEEFQKAGASYYVGSTQENIARLDAAIKRLRG